MYIWYQNRKFKISYIYTFKMFLLFLPIEPTVKANPYYVVVQTRLRWVLGGEEYSDAR